MVVQCYPIVCDAGPTLYQQWVSVSYLLGVSYDCVKKCDVGQTVDPLFSGTVSKAVAQH